MDFIMTIVEQGLIYGILTLGIYITYKILDFPDLTVDGSFPLGAAVTAALITRGVNPLALNAHLQNLPLAASSGCNATKCCVTQTPYLLGCFSYFLNFFNFCTY